MGMQAVGWKRWLGFFVIGIFCATIIAAVYAAVMVCIFASASGESIRFRLLLWLLAACLLILPVRITWTLLRRKWKTGTFRLSSEQLAAARARCAKPRPLYLSILIPVLYAGVAST